MFILKFVFEKYEPLINERFASKNLVVNQYFTCKKVTITTCTIPREDFINLIQSSLKPNENNNFFVGQLPVYPDVTYHLINDGSLSIISTAPEMYLMNETGKTINSYYLQQTSEPK